jgi:hypothetical protein
MSALALWSGVPGDAAPFVAAEFAHLDDVDRENARKFDAWWSPSRSDPAAQQLFSSQLDQADKRVLDLSSLAGFSFVYDPCGNGSDGNEAAPIVERHLGGEVDGKLAQSFAGRVTHRLISWLTSLFWRGRP